MIKKCFLIFTVLCLIAITPIQSNASEKALSWYCVRNKEHKQPVADENMEFITQYGGYYVDKRHGDGCTEKVIYLTFDAGYENGNVSKILDVLKEENVSGTFFILELLLEKNMDIVNRMINEGHTVGNHTATHKDISKVDSKESLKIELERLEKLYFEKTGRAMEKYFRPPEGKFSLKSMEYARDLGYKTIFWSFAYADWDNANQMDVSSAKKKIMDNIHNGAILLLHPTSKTNALILKDVIRELKAQGYKFGTMAELTEQTAT